MITDNSKTRISFNAVVESEIKCEKETILTQDEILEVLTHGGLHRGSKTFEIDQIDNEISQELNEMLLGLVSDELKNNCVSMIFTDIKVTFLD